jgi:uncharacterized protein
MSLLNYLYKDILQYVFNFYIDHFIDVHVLEKFTKNFKFDLKPFNKTQILKKNDTFKGTTKSKIIYLDEMKLQYNFYYENGNKFAEINYLYGSIEGKQYRWYNTSELKNVEIFKNGKKNGKSLSYYINGNIEYESIYKENKLDGIHKYYNSIGNLESEILYKDGVKDGIGIIYNKNTNDFDTLEYKNDVPIRNYKFESYGS